MSEEDPRIVELPDGRRVQVYNDGRKYLLSATDPVVSTIDELNESHLQENEALQQASFDEVVRKKSKLDNAGLPSEKSPI